MARNRLRYLVIHCTATAQGRTVSSAEIRRWHTSPVSCGGRGWRQVGYTDMIHLDGRVERMVDNNEDAWVDGWEVTNGTVGYNSISRHVVYVGGCAADGRTPKDTRTAAQRKALKEYVARMRDQHPEVQVVGHRDLTSGKACPSFDAQSEFNE